jgi:hypothetical protein
MDKRSKKRISVYRRDLWDTSPEWLIIREINVERIREGGKSESIRRH